MHKRVKEIPLFVGHLTYFALHLTPQIPNVRSNGAIPFFSHIVQHGTQTSSPAHFSSHNNQQWISDPQVNFIGLLLTVISSAFNQFACFICVSPLQVMKKRIPKCFSCNDTGFLVHSIKPYMGGVQVQLHLFLTPAIDGVKSLTSRSDPSTPPKALLLDQDWVASRAGLQVLDQGKIFFSTGIRTPDHPSRNTIAMPTTLFRVFSVIFLTFCGNH